MIKRLFGKCKWTLGKYSYLPNCKKYLKHKVKYYDDMKYCPFCGKKILYKSKIIEGVKDKEVENETN